jgi:hypothetical protein
MNRITPNLHMQLDALVADDVFEETGINDTYIHRHVVHPATPLYRHHSRYLASDVCEVGSLE